MKSTAFKGRFLPKYKVLIIIILTQLIKSIKTNKTDYQYNTILFRIHLNCRNKSLMPLPFKLNK